MIYILATKYAGQTAASFDGQTEEEVTANMATCGYTDVQIVDKATYDAFVAAHTRVL